MASELNQLRKQAQELGLEIEDENGKKLTAAQLKLSIHAAMQEQENGKPSDEELAKAGDSEAFDPHKDGNVNRVEAKERDSARKARNEATVKPKDKYRLNHTISLGGRRVDPGPRPVVLTAEEATPLLRLGHIERA